MKEEQFHFNGVNYSIRVGGNSKENDDLVKTSAKTDIWFHVGGARSSAHVILINTERLNAIPKQVIKRCACLCKSHSSSKSESKCGIVYTALANVLPTEIEGRVVINEMRKIIFI